MEGTAAQGGHPGWIFGAGGAGRAAVIALRVLGAEVTLVHRGEERGRRVAKELRVPYRSWEGFDPAAARVLVHATPLGQSDDDPLPFDPGRVSTDAVVVDMVYRRQQPTRLVRETRAAGRQAIDGRDVLVAQALSQFRLMTGHEMDPAAARQLVGLS